MSVEDDSLRPPKRPMTLDEKDYFRDENGKLWFRHRSHEKKIIPIKKPTRPPA